MSAKLYITSVGLCFFLCSCDQSSNLKTNSNTLATAFGEKLYISELDEHLMDATSKSDSQFIISRYVDSWLMDKILISEAKKKVKTSKDLDNKVDAYRKSLYIYELENYILQNHLNNEISQTEIDTFYKKYSNDFITTERICRLLYIKMPNSYDTDSLQSFWKTEDLPALKIYMQGDNTLALLNDEKWYSNSKIKSLLPTKLYKKINFKKTESYSYSSGETKYYVKLLESIKTNTVAPLSYVEDEIRDRILHDRSERLLREKRTEYFQENIKNKKITVNTEYE